MDLGVKRGKKTLKFERFSDWRTDIQLRYSDGAKVLFVPTMGALHQGHADLVRTARALADSIVGEPTEVVVSIFINPTQFNEEQDFATYPMTPDEDVQLLSEAGADAVVFPTLEEMYPGGVPLVAEPVDYGTLTASLEGEMRPGHFDGVVGVVRTLFELTQPHWAFFGEKDWQQLAVIRQLVALEFESLEVVAVPTRREQDGLAMSSRNQRLSAELRMLAPQLHDALLRVAADTRPAVVEAAKKSLEAAGFEVEYLSVARADTLESGPLHQEEMRVFAAVRLGGVRLIDNVSCM
ncbi:MAG: pantoate--beta-alanine ligase [Flavobacteriales bacterium]|nr:pantoate--beta-alanine ligase [Flavobacteriales bacterium]